jgi:hypothetical protein
MKEFCDQYNLMNVDVQYRYNTKALEYYRKRNECLVLG